MRRGVAFVLASMAIGLLGAATPVLAQLRAMPGADGRQFPATALRGDLTFGQPPAVTLDGQPEQLPPGVRIYGTNNLIVLSATLVGQTAAVNYTRDQQGALNAIWILTPQEAKQERKRAQTSLWQRFFDTSD